MTNKNNHEIDFLKEEDELIDAILAGEEKEIPMRHVRAVIEMRMDLPDFSNEDAWSCIRHDLEEKQREEEAREKRREKRRESRCRAELKKEYEQFLADVMELRGWTREQAAEAVNGCPRGHMGMFYSILEDRPGVTSWQDVVDSSGGLLD